MPDAAGAHEEFLRLAIELAVRGLTAGRGGPFGAVVVREGQVVATGVNEVTSLNDPTAHAEIQAVRAACRALGAFRLTDCDVYASCEPCPMCLGALYWKRPRTVYYAATHAEAAAAGFDDTFIREELGAAPGARRLPLVRLLAADGGRPFAAWRGLLDRIPY